ncbi:unnamed protein product [Mytilus coruscus]|uniref:Zinc finger PHD-type domain-containing protein n=1 Tax=Mytilus coruscus TaxID=42192 RepID=A0A6J8AM34_MYTCO|nr:unnamed protein product [Mytilus coruscus]
MELCKAVIVNLDTGSTKIEIHNNNDPNSEIPNKNESPNNKIKNVNQKAIKTLHTNVVCVVAQYNKSPSNISIANTSENICPICEKNVVNGDSIECCTCNMWIYKECSNLSDKQFKKQTSNENMVYKCALCDNLDLDPNENSMFISEMDIDREGTYTPLDLSIDNSEDSTIIETNPYNSKIEKRVIVISTLNDETCVKSAITETPKVKGKSLASDETKVKSVPVRHSPTVKVPSVTADTQHTPNAQVYQKVRKIKTKKKDTNEQDEQIAAFKARIIMLEEQNKDFSNTINLLHKKRCISTDEEKVNLL